MSNEQASRKFLDRVFGIDEDSRRRAESLGGLFREKFLCIACGLLSSVHLRCGYGPICGLCLYRAVFPDATEDEVWEYRAIGGPIAMRPERFARMDELVADYLRKSGKPVPALEGA